MKLAIRCDHCKKWKGVITNKPLTYKFTCDSCHMRTNIRLLTSKGDNFKFQKVPEEKDLGLVVKRLNELNTKVFSILDFQSAEDVNY